MSGAKIQNVRRKLRYKLARVLDRLSGQCWANLVTWANSSAGEARRDGLSPLPWRPVDAVCRSDAARNGRCYCGKLNAGGDL